MRWGPIGRCEREDQPRWEILWGSEPAADPDDDQTRACGGHMMLSTYVLRRSAGIMLVAPAPVVLDPVAAVLDAVAAMLERYRRFLLVERGLTPRRRI